MPSTFDSLIQSSSHAYHSQQQAAYLAASPNVYAQELLANDLLSYQRHYGSSSNSSCCIDPRFMNDFAMIANNEQLKHIHTNRFPTRSSPDPSKRHAHENMGKMKRKNSDSLKYFDFSIFIINIYHIIIKYTYKSIG